MSERSRLHGTAQTLADRTAAAMAKKDLDAALALVVGLAIEADLCDEASVTYRSVDGVMQTAAPSSELVQTADRLQYEFTEGPCVFATFTDDLLFSPQVGTDPRWPRWGPAAADLGIIAVMSAHLFADSRSAGSLNFYNRWARVYSEEDRELVRLIGTHASIALAHFRGRTHLWKAIDSRHQIGIAQGIMVHKFDITPEKAFEIMCRQSQDNNVKLHDVADHVARNKTLPFESDLNLDRPRRQT